MPSYRKQYKKPWVAVVGIRAEKKTYHLGYFATKEEAVAAEAVFKKANPGPGKAWPSHARIKSIAVRERNAYNRQLNKRINANR